MKEKIDESNDTTVKKFDRITKEINKMNREILNKKLESIKLKDTTIFVELKKQISEFKNNHKKDIFDINKKIKEELNKVNIECENKINNNLNQLKINFEKMQNEQKIKKSKNLK